MSSPVPRTEIEHYKQNIIHWTFETFNDLLKSFVLGLTTVGPLDEVVKLPKIEEWNQRKRDI